MAAPLAVADERDGSRRGAADGASVRQTPSAISARRFPAPAVRVVSGNRHRSSRVSAAEPAESTAVRATVADCHGFAARRPEPRRLAAISVGEMAATATGHDFFFRAWPQRDSAFIPIFAGCRRRLRRSSLSKSARPRDDERPPPAPFLPSWRSRGRNKSAPGWWFRHFRVHPGALGQRQRSSRLLLVFSMLTVRLWPYSDSRPETRPARAVVSSAFLTG